MFCIFSKNKNGTEQPIAYFESVEKAKAMIPPNAADWYVKDIGDLKTFMNTYKNERRNNKYLITSKDDSEKLETKKVLIFDTDNNLRYHNYKADVLKTPVKEDIIEDDFVEDKVDDKKAILSVKQASTVVKVFNVYQRQKPKIVIPQIKIKQEKKEEVVQKSNIPSPIKTYKPIPTEEDGKNVYRYSFSFFDQSSKPMLNKTYISNIEDDFYKRLVYIKGPIYSNKGFSIIVYEHTLKDAEKAMKVKLDSLVKEFKEKGLC